MMNKPDTCSALPRPLPELYADVRSGVAVISKVYPTPNCIAEPFEGEVIRIGGELTVEGFAYKVISEEQRNLINGLVKCANAYPRLVEALKALRQPYRSDWQNMTREEQRWANRLADDSEIVAFIDAALREAGEPIRQDRSAVDVANEVIYTMFPALRKGGE